MNKRLTLLALLLIAFALRLFRLETQSLWWDEGISLHLATSTLPEIAANRAANIHPPLYFFGLKGWVNLVGLTPFAVRYSSLLASWLQVTAVYALTRHWFNQRTALLAALLAALSPLSIIYGQETRVYALLPLIYLALLALTHQIIQKTNQSPISNLQSPPFLLHPSPFILLFLTQWLALHLHYISAFAIVYVSIWAITALVRQKRWPDLRRWLYAQIAVGLATLPWLFYVLAHATAVTSEASTGTYLSDPVPIPFLLQQAWVFQLTGLPGSLAQPLIQLLAALIAVCSTLVLLLRPPAPLLPPLFLAWIIPLFATFLAWSVRSFAHPRYITIFAILLIPLFASLIGDWRLEIRSLRLPNLQPLLSTLLFLTLLTISLVSLHRYFFNPATAKDDMRGVARYLETKAAPNDLLLVPDTDWSLPFEYNGETPIVMPQTSNRAAMWAHLQQVTAGKERVFTVDYVRGDVDWQDVVPFALEQAGNLTEQSDFGNLFVQTYELDRAVSAPEMMPQNVQFGPLRLTAVSTPPSPPADNAITLALQWQTDQPLPDRYHITLRLLDADNWQLAQVDRVLVDEIGRPTEQWSTGSPITTYHLIPLPPGTPPLTYDVALTLYAQNERVAEPLEILDELGAPRGQQWRLPALSLSPARGLSNPYRINNNIAPLAPPIHLAEGLLLLGAEVARTEVGSGQPLWVRLQWQAERPLPDLRPALQLSQNGQILAQTADAPAWGRYPTTEWGAGEMVVERRRLIVPATAVGPAQLILTLDATQHHLAAINISPESRLMEAPPISQPLQVRFGDVALLIGYDLPQTSVTADQPVPLTLYWQSLIEGSETEYVVFTHILAADGQLMGQHDGVPDNGRRPLSTWITGEYITDPHLMTFRQPYTGPAQIEVGLYDPASDTRLLTDSGDSFFYLPVQITVLDQ